MAVGDPHQSIYGWRGASATTLTRFPREFAQHGTPAAVHSIASGLDYPGVGPQHSYLKDIGRVQYEAVDDKETLNAFMTLSRVEGIIPALESSHAVAWAMRTAPTLGKDVNILVNLSGRGDKDADYVAQKLGL